MSLVSNTNKKRKAEDAGNRGYEEHKKAMEINAGPSKANKLRVPNKNNGWDFDTYAWGQTLEEVDVTVPLPIAVDIRGVCCVMKENYLQVGITDEPPIVAGRLFEPIEVDESFWALEDMNKVCILLRKAGQSAWWKFLIKGEPEIDIEKVNFAPDGKEK